MTDQMNTPISPAPAKSGNEQILAILSLVAGVVSLCGLVVPFIGIPLGIIGLALGYFGRRAAEWKTYATIGMALSGAGVLLSCVPMSVIAVMGLLGPKVGETFSSISNSLP